MVEQRGGARQIAGNELFFEHVHLNFDGNFAIAQALFPAVERALPASIAGSVATEVPACTVQRCTELLAYTPFDAVRMAGPIVGLQGKPPFLNQFNNAQKQGEANRWLQGLRRETSSDNLPAAVARYESALRQRPDDWRLHGRFALLLSDAARFDEAIEHLKKVVQSVPQHQMATLTLGQLLLRQGKKAEAEQILSEAVSRWPASGAAQRGLGSALAAQQKQDAALACYRKAMEIDPSDEQAVQAMVYLLASKSVDAARQEITQFFASKPVRMHLA